MTLPENVTSYTDRHGRERYRFRRTGLPAQSINEEPGTPEFDARVRECLAGIAPKRRNPSRAQKVPPAIPTGPVVYFIGTSGGFVKIGYTANLRRRLTAIKTSTHARVTLLAAVPGGREIESDYHARFAEARVRREWFRKTPQIEAELTVLANRGYGSPKCNRSRG